MTMTAAEFPTIGVPNPCDAPVVGSICGGVKDKLGEAAGAIGGSVLGSIADAVGDAVTKVLVTLGTFWVNIKTPQLDGGAPAPSGTTNPQVEQVMNYVLYISLTVAIGSLIVLGARLSVAQRQGEGERHLSRGGLILVAVIVMSGASAMVSQLAPAPRGAGAVGFLQSELWYYMGAAAIVGIIVGGARMAWEQRAQPGVDVLKAIITLVVVAGCSTTVIGLLTAAADSFSSEVLTSSMACKGESDCFGSEMSKIVGSTALAPQGAFLIIVLGLLVLLASLVQVMMMIVRVGMLVILAGILPLAASMTSTEMGRSWFKKAISWTVAFILFKPAAAIVYATAFRLIRSKTFEGDQLMSVLVGLTLLVLAIFTLPALMRFVTPMVGSMGSGGGGAALAVGGAVASGAMMISRSSGSGGETSAAPTASTGNNASGATSSTGAAPSQPSASPAGGGATPGGGGGGSGGGTPPTTGAGSGAGAGAAAAATPAAGAALVAARSAQQVGSSMNSAASEEGDNNGPSGA
jgi:hypothetical protein